MRKIEPERIKRAARIYASNQEASRRDLPADALGIAPGSFSRLCRLYNIETPYARKRRRREEFCRQRDDDLLEDIDLDLQEMEALEEVLNLN